MLLKDKTHMACNIFIITSAVLTMSGCDYFKDNWEVKGNGCQSLSTDNDAVATITKGEINFIRMEKGCPGNLDFMGTNLVDIEINGSSYAATLVCNDATNDRMVTIVGIPDRIPYKEAGHSSGELFPKAVKEFTAFLGAKITIEGQSYKFNKGNFTQACKTTLPGEGSRSDEPHGSFFKKLFSDSGKVKEKQSISIKRETPPDDAQARMMKEAGYEFRDGEWQKKPHPHATTSMSNEEAGFDITNKTIGRSAANKPKDTTLESPQSVSPAQSSSVTDKNQGPYPVNPNCRLDNGKYIYAYASPDGRDYNYAYLDKNEKQELELKDGLFGVTAFHYHSSFGMGSADYLRFNKGAYDYLVINKDNGKDNEFYGLQVYKNGEKIFSRECKGRMDMDFSNYPNNGHQDSGDKADYFLYQ